MTLVNSALMKQEFTLRKANAKVPCSGQSLDTFVSRVVSEPFIKSIKEPA
jgi:hypothetical protein